MMRIDPKEYAEGTLGALAPDLTDPQSPHNNPFNVNKDLIFFEVEMNIAEGENVPMAKPTVINNPGSIPTGFSLGISEPQEFVPPAVTSGVVNDLFPKINEPIIDGAPLPRQSALDKNYEKTIGVLPTYVLHPVDPTLTAKDGPGYSELEFKTKKPEIPNGANYVWEDAAKQGLSKKSVEWLTFLSHDKFFSDTNYQLNGTQHLSQNSSLLERLTNRELQEKNSIWKNITEDFLREIVFAPDLQGSVFNWEAIIAYVNYYMIQKYFNSIQVINVNDGVITLGEGDEKGKNFTTLEYLQKRIEEKTSLLLYKDKISTLDSYDDRKVLNAFFIKKTNDKNSDSETIADAMCRDLVKIALSTTLEALKSENPDPLSDDQIKDAISTNIDKYIREETSQTGEKDTIRGRMGVIIDDFISQGLFEAANREKVMASVNVEIRDLFCSLVGDLVISEARKYKLQCQISQIDQYLKVSFENIRAASLEDLLGGLDKAELSEILSTCENADSIEALLSALEEGDQETLRSELCAEKIENLLKDIKPASDPSLATEILEAQFPLFQRALKYVKGQLILLKNENYLPEKLVVEKIIIDGKPVAESNSIFKNVTDYLGGSTFDIKQYVDRRIRNSVTEAIQKTFLSEMKDSSIRDAIKKFIPRPEDGSADNSIQGKRENLRYALSKDFLQDLESYVVDRVLNAPVDGTDSLILSLVDQSVENLPIRKWINEGLASLLSGGKDEMTKKSLSQKYEFIDSAEVGNNAQANEVMRNNISEIVQELLKTNESYREDESPLVMAIEGQISEETLVLAYKDQVEAQLKSLESIILKGEIAVANGSQITAMNRETEKFLEYSYAKILKDHYEPIIYNDFVKYSKLLGSWFGKTSQAKGSKDVCELLTAKIEELRADYGRYYDAIQTFPLHGQAYLIGTESYRYPNLDNQYDLFSPFFGADRSTLNISQLLIDYAAVFNQYGMKCYSENKKYSVSDYSMELMKLLEKYAELARGDDIFSGAILQGIKDEQIALKRELEVLDLYTEYIKAENFREELKNYLLDETIEGWRSDAIRQQVLTNAIYRIAIDHQIMRVEKDGTYGSGTVNTNIVNPNGEKEYDESAGAYLYAKGIVEYVSKEYDRNKDIAVPVSEILNAIEAYRTSDLYQNEELLAQFKQLLVSNGNIPHSSGLSLFSFLTKYVSSNSIDFSLVTLFAGIYPTIKSKTYIPKGVGDLANKVLDNGTKDIKAKMKNCYAALAEINGKFFEFLKSTESDRLATLGNFLTSEILTDAAKTFDGGGHYAHMTNAFIGAYNIFLAGIKILSENLTELEDLNDSTGIEENFTAIQGKLAAVRSSLNDVSVDETKAGGAVNQAYVIAAIGDLNTLLNHIEVVLFLESLQVEYPGWYTDRGDGGAYGKLLTDLETFASEHSELAAILTQFITLLKNNDANYSLIENLGNTLTLKEIFNAETALPLWKATDGDSFSAIFAAEDYNLDTKFAEYGDKFNKLKEAMGVLMAMASAVDADSCATAIDSLSDIKLLSDLDGSGGQETSAEKNHYVYLFNAIAKAYNGVVTLLKEEGGAIGDYVDALAEYNTLPENENAIESVIEKFQGMHGAFSELEAKFGPSGEYMAAIAADMNVVSGVKSTDESNGTDGTNLLTAEESAKAQVILNWLLDILQQNKKATLSNMLAMLYPNWNTDFTVLKELKEKLKTFVNVHEVNADNVETRAFTITKSDCLKLLDAIDRAASDKDAIAKTTLEGLGEISATYEGGFKKLIAGESNFINPTSDEVMTENAKSAGDSQTVYKILSKLSVEGETPAKLSVEGETPANLSDLYAALSGIVSGGRLYDEIVGIGEIGQGEQSDGSFYDRSRWLARQFVSAYNKIVKDFKNIEENSEQGSLSALAAYGTAINEIYAKIALESSGDAPDVELDVESEVPGDDEEKRALIESYTKASVGLHSQLKAIVTELDTQKSAIGTLQQDSTAEEVAANLSANGVSDWDAIGDLSADNSEAVTITLNGEQIFIKKFKDTTSAREFYVAQSATEKTFLTEDDLSNLGSLLGAQIELYQSFNNQVAVNVANLVGNYGEDISEIVDGQIYSKGTYSASEFLNSYVIDFTGSVFTPELKFQIGNLTGKDLSLVEMYHGTYAYASLSSIEKADDLFRNLLHATSFLQLSTEHVFNGVINFDATAKTIGDVTQYGEATL
ncbi:MAG: hypothetical protein LBI77_01910, partial [Puniceicoccales bacterium]|nr:hypothetical protein [Puniceicoccales bacterium]